MWPGYPNPGASFFTDDVETQKTADLYGIVISTSHHEPMQRLSNEWFAENPPGTWNWLTNISSLSDTHPTLFLNRWNMTDAWLSSSLNISPNETFFVKDKTPYQFRYVDADPLDMPGPRFQEVISTALLSQLPHKLIQLGTLFGSSRLRLRRL